MMIPGKHSSEKMPQGFRFQKELIAFAELCWVWLQASQGTVAGLAMAEKSEPVAVSILPEFS